jgi:hypothetical protein
MKLKNFGILITFLGALGLASYIYAQTTGKVEEIDLSLEDTGTGHLQFKTLDKVLEYTNSEQQQSDGETEIINVYPNPDGWRIPGQPDRYPFELHGDQILRGVKRPTLTEPLNSDLELKPIDLKELSVIKNIARLYENSSIENIVFNGYIGVQVIEGQTTIRNNYFDTYGGALAISGVITGDVLIEGNIFVRKGVTANIISDKTVKFRNNTFYEALAGISSYDLLKLDLGSAVDYGFNNFVGNQHNMYLKVQPATIPAIGNFWTRTDKTNCTKDPISGSRLSDTEAEQEILKTMIIDEPTTTTVKNATSEVELGHKPVEVMPPLYELVRTPTAAKNWKLYF